MPASLSLGDSNAFLLIFLGFFVLLVDPVFRRDGKLLLAGWITVAAHQIVAFTEAYLFRVNPAMGDHLMFHSEAVNSPGQSIQSFSNILSWVYSFFGNSIAVGQQCSILVFVISIMLYVRLADVSGALQYRVPLLLLYGLCPSLVVHGSLTLREGYQVCSFLLCLYALFRFRETGGYRFLVLFVAGGMILDLFHHGLTVYVVFLFLLGLTWAFRFRPVEVGKVATVLALLAPVALPVVVSKLTGNTVFRLVVSGKGLEFTSRVREALARANARTEYGVELDTSSFSASILSVPATFGAYMLCPLPWQATTPMDMYVLLENVVRLILILTAARALFMPGRDKGTLLFLLVAGLSLEVMWSVGTTNWGTAVRHHMVAYPVFVLAGAPLLLAWTPSREKRLLRARRERRRAAMQVEQIL
jgi:hypothetical protein